MLRPESYLPNIFFNCWLSTNKFRPLGFATSLQSILDMWEEICQVNYLYKSSMIWIDVGTESSEASSMLESTSFKSFHFLPTLRRPSILSFSMRRSRSSQNTTNQDKRRLSLEDKELQPPKLGGERSKSISNFSRWQPAHWELNPFH